MKIVNQVVVFLFLVAILSSCGTVVTAPVATPTDAPATSIPATLTGTPVSTPTPEAETIEPANANRLVQLKQLGWGKQAGTPIFSPDGRWLFQPYTTGIYVRDATTFQNGHLLIPLNIASWTEIPMDISPDGKTLAIGSNVYAVEDGHQLPGLDIEGTLGEIKIYQVQDVQFSPDGLFLSLVISRQDTGQRFIGLWRLADGQLINTIQGVSTGFSVDSRLLGVQSTSEDKSYVSLYDTQTGELLKEWPGERFVFLPENRLAVKHESVVRVFDLDTGKARYAFDGKFAAFSSDGELVALLSLGQLMIYHVTDEKLVVKLEGDYTNIDEATLRFAPDDATVMGYMLRFECCGGAFGNLLLWDVTDGTLIKRGDYPSRRFVFSPDGQSVVVGTQVWRTSDGSVLSNIEDDSIPMVTGLAFLPDLQQLLVASSDELYFYDVNGENPRKILPIKGGHLALSPDYKIAVSGNQFWRVSDGQILEELNQKIILPSKMIVTRIAFNPDNKTVALGYHYGKLELWDINAQELLMERTVCSEGDRVSSLSFSPDGLRLAVTCSNIMDIGSSIIQIWSITPTLKRSMELKTGWYGASSVVYSPDGKYLATGETQVMVWNAEDGSLHFETSTEDPYGFDLGTEQPIAFSPDSKILVFGLTDGTVELWDVENGQWLSTLSAEQLHYNPVTRLTFSPDGQLLAVGHENGSVRLYGIE